MYENTYMYAIERSPEYLAHYGVRGMKWGVRKAIKTGNARRLDKQYAKAQKKLAKLQKQAANSKKYGRRAALMGAGAAAAGGLAAAGTAGVGRLVGGVGEGMRQIGYGTSRLAGRIKNGKVRTALQTAGRAVGTAGGAVAGTRNKINAWGNSNSLASGATDAYLKGLRSSGLKGSKQATRMVTSGTVKNMKSVSNNTIARIGAGVVGAGLAAGAARNAYKAATAQKRAAKFQSEMNKAFAGTKYGKKSGGNNGGNRQGKKRRNRG